ncbi:MAG: transglycosylase SLT domain-containing protein, partial [Deltaproteobacteria bacterium]|nr:transglycosylase SLT domain-containing protein [Deltaproteobacteria bacterium]
MKWNFLVFLAIGLSSWSSVRAEPPKSSHLPSLVSCLRIAGPLEFCGERVPIEIQEVRERFEKELLLSLWDRPQVILWLKRSRRYLPHIEKRLKERGVPDDLKYLAIAESALRPHAASKRGAVGFWQFTGYTGR